MSNLLSFNTQMDRPRPAELYQATREALNQLLTTPYTGLPPWVTREQAIAELREQLSALEPVKGDFYWSDERSEP
jgi:hypothetical protein